MARIGFVGTGTIAEAMVLGLAGQGHAILVSDRNADRAARLAREVEGLRVASNAEAVAQSDVVFLCLLANVAQSALAGLPFRTDHSVISVMVDVPLGHLRSLCAPATDIALTIPLPPIAVGGCPLPVYPSSPALEALFGDRNPVLTQPSEAALNAHLGASALCSPLLDQMCTAAEWLAGFSGDPDQAQTYISMMIRAYLPARAKPGDLGRALDQLSTEGGLNATLRAAMAPAKSDLRKGLDGFRERLSLSGDRTLT